MVIEHEKTFEVLRKDYSEQILEWLRSEQNVVNGNYQKVVDSYYQGNTMIDEMTILQMRTLLQKIKWNESEIKLVGFCGTKNDRYFGISFAGMFVGIETDGHAHS